MEAQTGRLIRNVRPFAPIDRDNRIRRICGLTCRCRDRHAADPLVGGPCAVCSIRRARREDPTINQSATWWRGDRHRVLRALRRPAQDERRRRLDVLRQSAQCDRDLQGRLAIALLGVYDDLKGTGATRKFAVQFAVAGLLYSSNTTVATHELQLDPDIELGVFAIPFTMLWIVGVVNAMNLIDGLDGLAGVVALRGPDDVDSCGEPAEPADDALHRGPGWSHPRVPFLQLQPRRRSMGDTGGRVPGVGRRHRSIKTGQKSSTAVAILTPIVALGLPILDTLLAMWPRRAVRGRDRSSAPTRSTFTIG